MKLTPRQAVAHLRANTLHCCDEVIRWAGVPSYFGPWFVIEGADTD